MKTERNGDKMWGTFMLHVYVSQYYLYKTLKEETQKGGVRHENKTQ